MKYIDVEWPESQFFMGKENVGFDPEKNIWFVPENIYNEITNENKNN